MPDTTGTTTEPALGLAPWVESIQAIKDDVDESRHVLTVMGLALLEAGTRPYVSSESHPLVYHALEVLAHYGLVTLRMNEAPGWWNVDVTAAGLDALARAKADRAADIADREGRLR